VEKSLEAYMNYVCPYCWHTLDECTCEIYPPYHLMFIDRRIQEHVRVLNSKGYLTTGCCEGHTETCVSTYISFAREFFQDDSELPEGFKYHKKKRMVFHEYKIRHLSHEAFELEKDYHIAKLLEWCRNLSPIESDQAREQRTECIVKE